MFTFLICFMLTNDSHSLLYKLRPYIFRFFLLEIATSLLLFPLCQPRSPVASLSVSAWGGLSLLLAFHQTCPMLLLLLSLSFSFFLLLPSLALLPHRKLHACSSLSRCTTPLPSALYFCYYLHTNSQLKTRPSLMSLCVRHIRIFSE